jgi:hypothetical protein
VMILDELLEGHPWLSATLYIKCFITNQNQGLFVVIMQSIFINKVR